MESDFRAFLSEEAVKLEKKRVKARRGQILYRYTIGILDKLLIAGVFIGAFASLIFPPIGLYVLGAIVVLVLTARIPVPIERYEDYLKNTLLPEVFKRVNPEFKYEPNGLNLKAIKASGIFNSTLFKRAEKILVEDRVSGQINGVAVDFNEVEFYSYPINWGKTIGTLLLIIIFLPLIIWRTVTDEGDLSSANESSGGIFIRDEVKFYRGLFLHADFHKAFRGSVYMIPKGLLKFKDRFSKELQQGSQIPLENAKLNELYQVTAPEAQMAYYLLSPKVLESIYEIYEMEKVLPIVILKNGQLYMTIPWDKDYFAVDLKTKIEGPEYFERYLKEIASFEKIVQHMNLDTRIWSKD